MFTSQNEGSRYSWPEMKQLWSEHASTRVAVDYDIDPDALGNVCYAGLPLWWNRHHAHIQERVFDDLMVPVLAKRERGPALDVGCGGGRWVRRLMSFGYSVTGIDLQEELISRNRIRYPDATFHTCALQDFAPEERFKVVSSVTVVQHVPFEEQPVMVARMSELLSLGGHAVVLENIRDQAAHVFSRSREDWVHLFEDHGFSLVAERRYDYSPMSRALYGLFGRVSRSQLFGSSSDSAGAAATAAATSTRPRMLNIGRELALSAGRRVDSVLERPLMRRQAPIATGHLGMLFRRSEPT